MVSRFYMIYHFCPVKVRLACDVKLRGCEMGINEIFMETSPFMYIQKMGMIFLKL